MLKIISFIIDVLLIGIIFIRVPKDNVGLGSFANTSDLLGSPSSANRFLNIVTISGILSYFTIAILLNFSAT